MILETNDLYSPSMVVGSFTIVFVIEVKVPSHLRSRAGTYLIDYPRGHLHYAIMPKSGDFRSWLQ